MKKIFSAVVLCVFAITSIKAQTKVDSVIITVGEKSKVIFAIGDKADLQTLKQYNFQAVVDDLVAKLEQQDSTKLDKPADSYLKTEEPATTQQSAEATTTREYRDRDDDWDRSWNERQSYNQRNERRETTTRYYGRRTHHSSRVNEPCSARLLSSIFALHMNAPWGQR